MRGLKDGASYMVAEQSPNQQNWQPYNKLKRPGEARLLAYQGIAHGADSSLYFQMRQSVGGQEKFHVQLFPMQEQMIPESSGSLSSWELSFISLADRFWMREQMPM